MGNAPPSFSLGVEEALGSAPCHQHHRQHGRRPCWVVGAAVLGGRASRGRVVSSGIAPPRVNRHVVLRVASSAWSRAPIGLVALLPQPAPLPPWLTTHRVVAGRGGVGEGLSSDVLSLAGRGGPGSRLLSGTRARRGLSGPQPAAPASTTLLGPARQLPRLARRAAAAGLRSIRSGTSVARPAGAGLGAAGHSSGELLLLVRGAQCPGREGWLQATTRAQRRVCCTVQAETSLRLCRWKEAPLE